MSPPHQKMSRKCVKSPSLRSVFVQKVHKRLDPRLSLKPRLGQFIYSSRILHCEVCNLDFYPVQFLALGFGNESTYMKSRRCTVSANDLTISLQIWCRSLSPTMMNERSKVAPNNNLAVKIERIVDNSATNWPIVLSSPGQIWCSLAHSPLRSIFSLGLP